MIFFDQIDSETFQPLLAISEVVLLKTSAKWFDLIVTPLPCEVFCLCHPRFHKAGLYVHERLQV